MNQPITCVIADGTVACMGCELTLGLALLNQPFLWVGRSDLTNRGSDLYPDGYMERIADHGKIVR